jgi:hypothetical protein
MSQKSKSNSHFNAHESRYLLSIIDDLREILRITNNTEYKVILERGYVDKIREVKLFLRTS